MNTSLAAHLFQSALLLDESVQPFKLKQREAADCLILTTQGRRPGRPRAHRRFDLCGRPRGSVADTAVAALGLAGLAERPSPDLRPTWQTCELPVSQFIPRGRLGFLGGPVRGRAHRRARAHCQGQARHHPSRRRRRAESGRVLPALLVPAGRQAGAGNIRRAAEVSRSLRSIPDRAAGLTLVPFIPRFSPASAPRPTNGRRQASPMPRSRRPTASDARPPRRLGREPCRLAQKPAPLKTAWLPLVRPPLSITHVASSVEPKEAVRSGTSSESICPTPGRGAGKGEGMG